LLGFYISLKSLVDAPAWFRYAFKDAQPEIMRAAGKGLIHKNTSARKVSRLAKRIKAMG